MKSSYRNPKGSPVNPDSHQSLAPTGTPSTITRTFFLSADFGDGGMDGRYSRADIERMRRTRDVAEGSAVAANTGADQKPVAGLRFLSAAPTSHRGAKPDSATGFWPIKGHSDAASSIDKAKPSFSQRFKFDLTTDNPEILELIATITPKLPAALARNKKSDLHLRAILANLYDAWSRDPEFKVSYSRSPNKWPAKSRYNSQKLSKSIIDVFTALDRLGLIEHAKGFNDRRPGGQGRESRAWASPALAAVFAKVADRNEVTAVSPHRESIILRGNEEGEGKETHDIEYGIEPDAIAPTRQLLDRYNTLLRKSFIDIPELESSFILTEDERGRVSPLWINQSDKFVRRIFNRGSWEKGGRFYGGWWQNCPEEWRTKIFINDKPTVEVDFSGHHIAMLYANKGIDFGALGIDAYTVETPEQWPLTDDERRAVCKDLMLIVINATDEKKAAKAFQNKQPNGSFQKGISNGDLGLVLDRLKEKHQPIAEHFANDAGIDLMRQDSDITAILIDEFTADGEVILTIHDSYIVDYDSVPKLKARMAKAFEKVTGVSGARLDAFVPLDWRTARQAPGFGTAEAFMEFKRKAMGVYRDPVRSARYRSALQQWLN